MEEQRIRSKRSYVTQNYSSSVVRKVLADLHDELVMAPSVHLVLRNMLSILNDFKLKFYGSLGNEQSGILG